MVTVKALKAHANIHGTKRAKRTGDTYEVAEGAVAALTGPGLVEVVKDDGGKAKAAK